MSYLESFLVWAQKLGYASSIDLKGGSMCVPNEQRGRSFFVSIDHSLFEDNFESYSQSGRDYWPDADSTIRAFRLLTVHIDEAIGTASPGSDTLKFRGHYFE